MSFNHKTIEELHDLLVSKEISATELTQATLDDIKAREEAVNAFVTVAEEAALAQAKAIDEKGIDADNLLSGIPFAVKDNISTDGILTTAASKMLYNYEPIFDATAVANAKAKGMIVVGKTNMDEFAMGGSGETSYYGPTKNAWDHSKVPGGSSSGSAASVASGQVRLSLGSDTGGSIRQPASFTGIVGMKPTYGRISRYGLIAFASSLDQIGTFTNDVEDCAIVLNGIAGYDKKDSTSVPQIQKDYRKALVADVKGLRIGIPEEFFAEGLDADCRKALDEAIETYKKLGAHIVSVKMPNMKYGLAAYYIIAPAEASSNLGRYDGVGFGLRVPGKDIVDMYIKTRSEGFGPEVKRRILLGTYVLSAGYYDAYYLRAMKVRTLVRQDYDKAFESCDVLLTPTAPDTAFKIGQNSEDPLAMYLGDVCTVTVNLAGLPAISLPCGFKNGLPVGMQLIGKALDEETLLRAAYTFERERTDLQLPLPMGEVEV